MLSSSIDPKTFCSLLRAAVWSLVLLAWPGAILAQSADDGDDLQSWNDVELTVPVNEKFEVNTAGTFRFDRNLSKAESYRFTFGATYRPVKNFSLAPFHTFISSRNSAGRHRYEYRWGLSGSYKFQLEAFSLSHRSRIEHRSRPGRNSWRYRPAVTIEKKLPETFIKGASVFVTEEPFYDSVSGRFARNRISGGVKKSVSKKFAVELYYLFQGDNVSDPGSIHVLGTAWKIRL